jgi:hypothetical protein
MLTLTGTALTLTIAGCTGDDTGDEENAQTPTETATATATTTATETPANVSDYLDLLEVQGYNEGEYERGFRGRVENISDRAAQYAAVEIVYLTGDGVRIGEGLDNVTNLSAGRVWSFDIPYTGDRWYEIDNYEVFLEVRP